MVWKVQWCLWIGLFGVDQISLYDKKQAEGTIILAYMSTILSWMEMINLKLKYLSQGFEIKDLGNFKNFLGIEVGQNTLDISTKDNSLK